MKLVLLTLILICSQNIFTIKNANANELRIAPFAGYGQANFYGQTDVPTYQGYSYGGILEYKQVWDTFSLGYYVQFSKGSFENTNNTNLQEENLETQNITGGFKIYLDSIYLKAGYGLNKSTDKSSGTVTKEIKLENPVYQAGIGTNWTISSGFSIFFEVEANYSKYKPEFGGLTKPTELLTYTGIIGFSFLIPSGNILPE